VKADLRNFCPPIRFQGETKSCYAQAAIHAYETLRRKNYGDERKFSSQFVYYNSRLWKRDTDIDSGISADETLMAMFKYGACLESDFKYSIDDFAESPAPQIYINASFNKIRDVTKLDSLMDIWDCLDAGYPVIFNYMQHASQFTEAIEASGVIPMPKEHDVRVQNHAVCAVGYDIHKQHIIFANSYGDKWGDKGYGYLPFDFVRDVSLAGYFRTFKG